MSKIKLKDGTIIDDEQEYDYSAGVQDFDDNFRNNQKWWSENPEGAHSAQEKNMGALDPENAEKALIMLSMMSFPGKTEIEEKIKNNASMYRELNEMTERVAYLENMLYGSTSVQTRPDGASNTAAPKNTPGAEYSGSLPAGDYAAELVKRANDSVREGPNI